MGQGLLSGGLADPPYLGESALLPKRFSQGLICWWISALVPDPLPSVSLARHAHRGSPT